LANIDTTQAPVVAQTTCIEKPELLSFKSGYMKIRLSYLTWEPKHFRSITLKMECGAQPPFTEDICILLPCSKVFAVLETFIPMFDTLRRLEIVSKTAKLQDFTLFDEDHLTLAYLF
jgi:hypothetical protein